MTYNFFFFWAYIKSLKKREKKKEKKGSTKYFNFLFRSTSENRAKDVVFVTESQDLGMNLSLVDIEVRPQSFWTVSAVTIQKTMQSPMVEILRVTLLLAPALLIPFKRNSRPLWFLMGPA